MNMTRKTINVEGFDAVQLSSDAGFDKWLSRKEVAALFNEDGVEIIDFDTLVDGGKYSCTFGPPPQQENDGK